MGYTHLAIYTVHRHLCSTENCETISCYLKHCHEKESVTLEKRIRIKEGRHREREIVILHKMKFLNKRDLHKWNGWPSK